jgi:hypothetical protein
MNVSSQHLAAVLLSRGMLGLSPTDEPLMASLHSADPGEYGEQIQAEVRYDGYSRHTLGRSESDWTINEQGAFVYSAGISFGLCRSNSPQTARFLCLSIGDRVFEKFEVTGQIGLGVDVVVPQNTITIYPV